MQRHDRAFFLEEFYNEVPQATYENDDFWYNLSPRYKAEHTAACDHAISDGQFLLFCNVTTFVGAPKPIENRAGHDTVRTMQSVRCNPHDAIRTMQSTQYNLYDAIHTMHTMQSTRYNPHDVHDAICAMQSQSQSAQLHDGHNGHDGYNGMATAIMTNTRVMTATTATGAMMAIRSLQPRGHDGHERHDGHKGYKGHKAKTSMTVTMTRMVIAATVASRSCWLHKISEVGALMSWSLKVAHLRPKVRRSTHLRVKVGRLAHLHFKAHKSAHLLKINVYTFQKLVHLEYTLQVGVRTSLRSTYLYPSGAPHTSRLQRHIAATAIC